ncbi:MAG TPA: vWA domain-containing protein [Kofleriaceae bacterium]|nr:vWA domain-containing protein [Kofleriaceae bacterium]
MRRSIALTVLGLAAALATACTDRDVDRVEPSPSEVDTWNYEVSPSRDLDILFVVDNSGSMAGEQASLAANFPAFMGVLETIDGGLPNVHIGIVSSNVGAAGLAGVPGCAGQGDDGKLLVKAGCSGLDGQFISDVADEHGDRIKNYSGRLEDLFGCMAQLGTNGCGFEMHLESMYRALQPGANPGFYRPDAYLAVIVIGDEDDCSTELGTMFGDPTAGLASPLGPRTSFRCFEFGVRCDGDANPRAFGTKTGCEPRASSPYMYDVAKYVEFLRGLKSDPSRVIVAGITGVDDDRHTVVVGPDPTTPANPSVEKSCFLVDPADPNDGATPPIRIGSFLRSFAGSVQTSICSPTLEDALVEIAHRLQRVLDDRCVERALLDVDPVTPGPQYQCSVMDVVDPDGADRRETVVPACTDTAGAAPCWRIAPDPERCPAVPDQLAIEVVRGGTAPPVGTHVEAQCLAR